MEEADREAKKDHTNPAKATLENARAIITTVQTATGKKSESRNLLSFFYLVTYTTVLTCNFSRAVVNTKGKC